MLVGCEVCFRLFAYYCIDSSVSYANKGMRWKQRCHVSECDFVFGCIIVVMFWQLLISILGVEC